MFCRILVVADDSTMGHSALRYAGRMAEDFGAEVRSVLIRPADHQAGRALRFHMSKAVEVEIGHADHVVSGATRSKRDKQIVAEVATEAQGYGADVIVFGLDPRPHGQGSISRRLRCALATATGLPIMFPSDTQEGWIDGPVASPAKESTYV